MTKDFEDLLQSLAKVSSSEKDSVIIAPVSKKIIKKMQEEIGKNKDPCKFSKWASIRGELNYSDKTRTKIICYPKEECTSLFIIKIVIPFSDAIVTSVENEIKVLKFLKKNTAMNHFPNLYDHFDCTCTITTEYPITCLVMDYFDLSLMPFTNDPNTPSGWWLHLFTEVVKTIAILEKLKINHNDIHFGNLMFEGSPYGPVKLIDFGTATSSNPKLKLKLNYSHTFHGYVSEGFILGKDLCDFCYFLRDYNFATSIKLPKNLMKIINKIINSKKKISAIELTKKIRELKAEIPPNDYYN